MAEIRNKRVSKEDIKEQSNDSIVNWIKVSKRKVEEEGGMSSPERNYAERSGKLKLWKGSGH